MRDDGTRHLFLDDGDVLLRVEADGAFRCVNCGARWHPRRWGDMSPYHQDLGCPNPACPGSPGSAILPPPPLQ
jgi:hypothetical protein